MVNESSLEDAKATPAKDRQQRCIDHGMKYLAPLAAPKHGRVAVLPRGLSQDQGRGDGVHRRF